MTILNETDTLSNGVTVPKLGRESDMHVLRDLHHQDYGESSAFPGDNGK